MDGKEKNSQFRKEYKANMSMIIVVRKSDNKILSRYEAWELGAYSSAMKDISGNGYRCLGEEITFMSNLVIWVE